MGNIVVWMFLLFLLVSPLKAKEEKVTFVPFYDYTEKTTIKEKASSIALSPDGKILAIASGGWNGTIKIWDVEKGVLLKILEGHFGGVSSVAFSPYGSFLASGGGDKDPIIKIWNVEKGTLLMTFVGHSRRVYSLAFSPDGKILASASEDGTIKIWDLEKRVFLKTLKDSGRVLFGPKGKILASRSEHGIKLWDVESGALLKTLEGGTSIAFSPDGKILVSTEYYGIIKFWDVERGVLLKEFNDKSNRGLLSVAFSPDGRVLALASEYTINLLDVESGALLKKLEGHLGQVYSVSFSSDGKILASLGRDNIKIWEKRILHGIFIPFDDDYYIHNRLRMSFDMKGLESAVSSMAFIPSRNILVTGDWGGIISFWDVEKGTLLKTIERSDKHSYIVGSLALSPDERILASGSWDKTIKLWDVESGALLKTLKGHRRAVHSLAFSPDGRILVSASDDGTIKFWDVEKGVPLKTLKNYRHASNLTFSPDGKILAFASYDASRGRYTINLWDVEKGVLLKTLGENYWRIVALVFSQDGKILASWDSDGIIKIWDIERGALLKEFRAQRGYYANSLAFSPDGRFLASGNGELILWDTNSWNALKILKGPGSGRVMFVAFSKDGKLLISLRGGSTVEVWEGKMPPEMYEIRREIKELEKEIVKLKKEKEHKIAQLYTPKGEFETTKEYQERMARARQLEQSIREEYARKIREIEDKKEKMVKEAQLKLIPYETSVFIKNYDADRGGFYAVVELYEVFIPVERSIAMKIAQNREKAVVKGKLRFIDTEKCELVDAFLTVKGTDVMVPFGKRTKP